MLIWFRWHYDKKLLRNIDEDEFLEFTAKCPQRQAIMVQRRERDIHRDWDTERDQGRKEAETHMPRQR